MPGKRKEKEDFCYIKDGKILKDSIGLTAKAEKEAEELIEEIKQLEEQRTKQVTDEVDDETAAIVKIILEAFKDGPLKWKHGSDNKRKSEKGPPGKNCPETPENAPRGNETTKQGKEVSNEVVTSKGDSKMGISDKAQCDVETEIRKSRLSAEGTRTDAIVEETNASNFAQSKSPENNKTKSELLQNSNWELAKYKNKTKFENEPISSKGKQSGKALFKVADGKMFLRMKKDNGNIYIPGATANVAEAKAKDTTTAKHTGNETKKSAENRHAFHASGLGVDVRKKRDYGSESSRAKTSAAEINIGNTAVTGLKTGTKTGVYSEATGLKINAGNSDITGIDNRTMVAATVKTGASVNVANLNAQAVGHTGLHATADLRPGIDCFNVNVGLRRNTGVSVTNRVSFFNINLTIGPPTLSLGFGLNFGIPFLSGGGGADEGAGGNSGGDGGDGGECGGREGGDSGGAENNSGGGTGVDGGTDRGEGGGGDGSLWDRVDGGGGGDGDNIQNGEDGNGDGGRGANGWEEHNSGGGIGVDGGTDRDEAVGGDSSSCDRGDGGEDRNGDEVQGGENGNGGGGESSGGGNSFVVVEFEKPKRRRQNPRDGMTRRGNIIENFSMDDKGNIIPSEDEFLIVINDPDPEIVEGVAHHFGATQCHSEATTGDIASSTGRNRIPDDKNIIANGTHVGENQTHNGEGNKSTTTRQTKVNTLHMRDGKHDKNITTNTILTDHTIRPPPGKQTNSSKVQNGHKQKVSGLTCKNMTPSNTTNNQRQFRHGETSDKTLVDHWQTRPNRNSKNITDSNTPADRWQVRSSGNCKNNTDYTCITPVDYRQARTGETDRNTAGSITPIDHRQARSSGNGKRTTGYISQVNHRQARSGKTDRNTNGRSSKTLGDHKRPQAHKAFPNERHLPDHTETAEKRHVLLDKPVTPHLATTPREPILKRPKVSSGCTFRRSEQRSSFDSDRANGSRDGQPSRPGTHGRNLSDRKASGTALSRKQINLNLHDSASYNKHMYTLISKELPNDSTENETSKQQGSGKFDWSDTTRVKDEILKSRGLLTIGQSNQIGKSNGKPPNPSEANRDRAGYGSGSADDGLPPIAPVKKSPPKKPFGEKGNIHTIFTIGGDSDTKEIVYKKDNVAYFRDKDE